MEDLGFFLIAMVIFCFSILILGIIGDVVNKVIEYRKRDRVMRIHRERVRLRKMQDEWYRQYFMRNVNEIAGDFEERNG